MRLPPFQLLEPESLQEVLTLLEARKEKAQLLAGGTDLLNRVRLGLANPETVISLGKIRELEGIEVRGREIIVGAATKLREIVKSSVLEGGFRALAEAAYQVASPTLQNMGTTGGNLLQNTRCLYYNQSPLVLNGLESCHKRGGSACLAVKGSKRCFSVYQGDLAPALIAFEARCVLEKRGSSRTIPVADLFTGNGLTPFRLQPDEVLTKIILPLPEGPFGSAYQKLRLRGSIDYPLVSVAAFVSATPEGERNRCCLVLGAVGAAPKRMDDLSGEVDFEALAQRASDLAEAIDNLQMPGSYRKKMAGVLAKRAMKEALARMKGVA
ncbi:MAG: FAD binding domain-containing protein [Desulfobacterota bacterium]|nr:FAD binding domain-containing protein [Thermodesulfobacteriota bacterium]